MSGSETEQEGDDLALELENELLGDLAEFSDEVHEEKGAQNDWEPRQSSDWRFDVEPAAGEAVSVHEEPSVDMAADVDVAADMADELDESFAPVSTARCAWNRLKMSRPFQSRSRWAIGFPSLHRGLRAMISSSIFQSSSLMRASLLHLPAS
ncbi:hypothetical protein [Nitratireductor aquibiodomus]|uniref:hypothetical protein n=1 Tax=Nitratireductor aquibiodomus TaxID=204799 RepID=UPI00138DD4DF|nr:hypothetical protein [Nitratireductor aquibiodomus]